MAAITRAFRNGIESEYLPDEACMRRQNRIFTERARSHGRIVNMPEGEIENGLFEPVATLPIYYDGIRTQIINEMLHLVFWVRQPQLDTPGATEKVVVARMVTRTSTVGSERSIVNEALELAAMATKSSH